MSHRYVALIADAADSRRLTPAARARLQEHLRSAVREFNKRYQRELAARFAVTLGDELQCLLRDTRAVWEISHYIRHKFDEVDWVVACGKGVVTTKLTRGITAPEVDGPCFHEARAALEAAKQERRLLALGGFPGQRLAAFANYYSALYWSWTSTQRREANRWRYWSMSDARLPPMLRADKRHPSAVSHLRRRMAWPLVDAGDKMFRALLEAS